MWWRNIMADRVTTAVLKEKIDNVEKVFNRIDDAIVKIVEVNNNVSKMLAVHDERLVKQEKIDEVLFKKIDDLHTIIIKLIDAKNVMVDKFQELNDEVTDQLNYIEAKLGNGRGSKQKRKAKGR